MPRTIEARSQSSVCLGRSGGFTLTEVMFAVILLGIGFIMVAAMFPVALRQAKLSIDETAAAQVGRAAVQKLDAIATNATMPATGGNVHLFHNGFQFARQYPINPAQSEARATWDAIKGDLIFQNNPHYAWTMVYRRGGVPGSPSAGWDKTAQVYVFVMQRPDVPYAHLPVDLARVPTADPDDAFLPSDLAPFVDGPDRPYLPNLAPRPVSFVLTERSDTPLAQPDIITFVDDDGNFATPQEYYEGAFVIVGYHASDTSVIGKVYRVGAKAQDIPGNPGTAAENASYELLPGWDMPVVNDPSGTVLNENIPARDLIPVAVPGGTGDRAFGFIFGKGYRADRLDVADGPVYSGVNMGVYMYTGFVRVK